jgi:hypothetical protein
MNEASSTSSPTTSSDSASAISSPDSAAGPSQPGLLDGLMLANSGPGPRPVSRSRSRVKEKLRLTIGTCGPTFSGSSIPDGPLSSWENRLRRRLARHGSTESSLTWKESTTPGGRPLSRLVPSMRPIDGTDFGLWPTPSASEHKMRLQGNSQQSVGFGAKVTHTGREVWPFQPMPGPPPFAAPSVNTPSASETPVGDSSPPPPMAPWPTPTASEYGTNQGGSAGRTGPVRGSLSTIVRQLEVSHWPTPMHTDGTKACNRYREGRQNQLGAMVSTALWATPTTRDHKNSGDLTNYIYGGKRDKPRLDQLSTQIFGLAPPGSNAPTAKPGAMNPAFPCWVMGFPLAWDDCAPTATRSSPKSRPK